MPWYIYPLGSAVFFASQELLMRVMAVRSHSPRVASVIFNLWGAVFAVTLFLLQKGSFRQLFDLTWSQYALLVAAIILYGLYERFQFFARKGVEASTLAILFKLTTVIAFTGSIVLLGELLTFHKMFGALLIVGGTLLLVYRNPKFEFTPAFGFAIFCVVIMGIAQVVDKLASAPMSATLYSFILWTAPICIIAFPGFTKREFFSELKIGSWKVPLAAFLNVSGYILLIRAYALADASRVIPIMSINGILAVLGGIVLLRERDHLWRKLAAGLIAFTGVYLLK